jgi:cyclophilin family peptidyl-prolyl cis-trans isomerase
LKVLASVLAALLLAGCSSSPKSEKASEAPKTVPVEKPSQPADSSKTYKVRFTTSKGPFIVEVHRDWAPIGAARFEELIKDKYYDGARFFRIVPNFVVQFGLAASPAMTKKWDKAIKDDPVAQTNRVGALAFATNGRNTRTTQVFISLRSNQVLDSQDFAPFAQVIEGMDVVTRLNSQYGEGPDQEAITKRGNAYLSAFPKLDYIQKATIL